MRLPLLLILFLNCLFAQTVEWPVNGGPDNIRYSPLTQINRDNVTRLRAAWTYDSHDSFKDSEMQSNPIVVDGVLYATTPKLRVIALDAATGRELWSFNPNVDDQRQRRYRHRGVTVYNDRVFFTHRNYLWALDRRTGKPIQTLYMLTRRFPTATRVWLRGAVGRLSLFCTVQFETSTTRPCAPLSPLGTVRGGCVPRVARRPAGTAWALPASVPLTAPLSAPYAGHHDRCSSRR